MQIQHRTKVSNQQWRHDPVTGFTRCTAVILEQGVMEYSAAELGGHPGGKPTVRIFVPLDQMAQPASITSLEGMPVVDGHVWQTSDNVAISCGAVAGSPTVRDTALVGDLLVTDKNTGGRIMRQELQEISSAFDALVIWEPGADPAGGQPFDGRFENIRYNHVALLPAGKARGGGSVRIINQDKPKMEFTRIKLPSGRAVRVVNEDVPVIDDEVKDQETKAKNAIDPAGAAKALTELADKTAQLEALTKEVEDLRGQLQGFKDQLDAAMGGDKIEAAAEEMTNQRQEASAVLNSHGLKLEGDSAKLRGHQLRVHVVNAISTARGKPALADEQAKNEPFVQGMYQVLNSVAAVVQTPPAGHAAAVAPVVKVENEAAKPNMSNPADRRKALGY